MNDLALHGVVGKRGGGTSSVADWERPSEWPSITSLVGPSDDHKFAAVFAVPSTVSATDGQPVVFNFHIAGSGTYDVDWGDGTSDTGIASEDYVGHLYDPASVSLTTTSYGYKVAIIEITASDTIINFNLTPGAALISGAGLPGTWDNSAYLGFTWLDIRLAGLAGMWSYASKFTQIMSLQKVEILNSPTSGGGLTSMFANCFSLKQIIWPDDFTQLCNNFSSTFTGCSSLFKSPPISINGAMANMTAAFSGCNSMVSVDITGSPSGGNFGGANCFSNCYALREIPLFDTSKVNNFANFFSGCYSLKEVPAFNTSNGTSFSNMFANCTSLVDAPFLDTSLANNCTGMFDGCYSLRTVPLYDFSDGMYFNSLFRNCTNLETLPDFDFSSGVSFGTSNLTGTFYNCQSLIRIPALDLSSVTSTNNIRGMFRMCTALLEVPACTFGTVTVASLYAANFDFLRACTRIAFQKFPTANITLVGCFNLGGDALDEIFTNLPTVGSNTINVTPCRGRSLCDPTIATAKGWTVTT